MCPETYPLHVLDYERWKEDWIRKNEEYRRIAKLSSILVKYEEIDRRNAFVFMMSHQWSVSNTQLSVEVVGGSSGHAGKRGRLLQWMGDGAVAAMAKADGERKLPVLVLEAGAEVELKLVRESGSGKVVELSLIHI